MKRYILIILIFNFLQSCSSVSEGFKLKKGNTGDEFLVEKKNPLVLPPNFNKLPEPGKTEISNENTEKSFEEKILNNDKKNENQEVLKQHLQGMPKFKPKKTDKEMFLYEVIGENNFTNNTPRLHSVRDANIFEILAKDIENGIFKYSTTQSKKELYFEKTGRKSNFHKYHVLEYDKPSNTIPAHLHKDGLCHIHPDSSQKRSITPREAARIQSFPDDFDFVGPMTANYKMIGNAVPPKFSKSIADSLLQVL